MLDYGSQRFQDSFTNSDLVARVLTIPRFSSDIPVNLTIYTNTGEQVIPESVLLFPDRLEIDLTGLSVDANGNFVAIAGTWQVAYS